MKRIILSALGILVFNIIIELSAAIALMGGIFRDDKYTAIVFGSIALIGVLLQPWWLLMYFLPWLLFVLGPILVTIISLGAYYRLSRWRLLAVPVARLRKVRVSRLLVGCAIFIVILAVFSYSRVIDFPAGNPRIPPVIAQDIKAKGIQQNRSYCISDFIYTEWLWQARVTPEQMTSLCAQYHLNTIPTTRLSKEFFTMLPYWWKPKVTRTAQAYATEAIPDKDARDEMMHIQALWDTRSQLLYVWIRWDTM